MNEPLVSVVVIGRNEGQRLAACLESVKETINPGGGIELIYVDSNSQDGSPELAETVGAKVLRVKSQRPCAAIGRNAGWLAATAPYILFLNFSLTSEPLIE